MSEVQKKGVKELSEVLVFAIELVKALDAAMLDKKLDLADLGLLIKPFTKAPQALEGLGQIGGELKDLDAAEMAQLQELVKTELDLSNDKVEEKIEAGVEFLGALHTFIIKVKA